MARTNKHSDSYARLEDEPRFDCIQTMLNSVPEARDKIIIKLFLEAGCTVSELVGIRVEDISSGFIVLKKKRKNKLSCGFQKELKNYIKSKTQVSPFLFSSRQSRQLNPRRVQQIVKQNTGMTPSTLRKIWLGEAIKHKTHKEVVSQSGLKRLRKKSFLTEGETRRIRSLINDKNHMLLFDVLNETGCAVSELINLKAKDIGRTEIRIPNVSKLPNRSVKLRKTLIRNLREHIKEMQRQDFIFSTRQSPQISDKRVLQILKQYGNSIGIKLNPRLIRNSRIARMKSKKCSSQDISRELGISLDLHSFGILTKDG